MGIGIAQVCALAGYQVLLYDKSGDALDIAGNKIHEILAKGVDRGKISEKEAGQVRGRLEFVEKLEKIKTDLIIEAIVEVLEVKRDLFSTLEKINDPSTIFATNTSSIPITQIASVLSRPQHLVGLHFFNPAHIMKLVEVIAGASTSTDVLNSTRKFAKSLGKVSVMAQDSPGFIVNRVARHYYVESLKILEEGVANVVSIDKLLESTGFKLGPFRLMDLIGVDTNLSVTTSMYNAFYQEPKFRPNRIQQQKVDAGHWGNKTGKGFYNYET